MAMILYHGSNVAVEVPKLMPGVRALDFGQAFYLTSDREQAAKWAKTSVLRRGEGVATVSVYEVDEARLGALRVLRFVGPTADKTLARIKSHGLFDYAVGMYELYHVEDLENAFADLDRRMGK